MSDQHLINNCSSIFPSKCAYILADSFHKELGLEEGQKQVVFVLS